MAWMRRDTWRRNSPWLDVSTYRSIYFPFSQPQWSGQVQWLLLVARLQQVFPSLMTMWCILRASYLHPTQQIWPVSQESSSPSFIQISLHLAVAAGWLNGINSSKKFEIGDPYFSSIEKRRLVFERKCICSVEVCRPLMAIFSRWVSTSGSEGLSEQTLMKAYLATCCACSNTRVGKTRCKHWAHVVHDNNHKIKALNSLNPTEKHFGIKKKTFKWLLSISKLNYVFIIDNYLSWFLVIFFSLFIVQSQSLVSYFH